MDCCPLWALSFPARLWSLCLNIYTDIKHPSIIDPPINSALFVMVLGIGVTFQIIKVVLSTAIDSVTWMVNSKIWHASCHQPTCWSKLLYPKRSAKMIEGSKKHNYFDWRHRKIQKPNYINLKLSIDTLILRKVVTLISVFIILELKAYSSVYI